MENKKNLPYIPLYTGDWEKDCNVLSLEAEAAWLRVIFKMFNNGKQSSYKFTTKALQNLWRVTPEIMVCILDELKDNDICRIEKSDRYVILTSRRYEKENMISEKRRQAVNQRKDRTNNLQKGYKKDSNNLQNTEIEIEINKEIVIKEEKEVKEEEREKKKENSQEEKLPIRIDYQQVVDLYHTLCPSLPKVMRLSEARKKKVKSRLADMGNNMDTLRNVFEAMETSRFLRGENKSGWKATFDWIFENSENYLKVLEGSYSHKGASCHTKVNEIWTR